MQLVRALIVLVAVAAAVGQFLQEHYRLLALQKVRDVRQARDQYERRRVRSERLMLLLAIGSGLAGLVALGDMAFGFGSP